MRDGHIHTPFCPHGSKEPLESYVEAAIKRGIKQMTFTEHAPLPPSFSDPTPLKDSAMAMEDVEAYIFEVERVQNLYKKDIQIQCGFEIDFIKGFEEETYDFLLEFGNDIEDSILSVHFLEHNGKWFCLDYDEHTFGEMVTTFGSLEAVYDAYYSAVYDSIVTPLGPDKPWRIGHMTLVHKFQKLFPPTEAILTKEKEWLDTILKEIKDRSYEVDCNGAGMVKPFCNETYPPLPIIEAARKRKIRCVYGSDAHHPDGLFQGITKDFETLIRNF